jgi:hypothetical protein
MKNIDKKLKNIIEDVMSVTLDRSLDENRLEGWIDMKIDPSTLSDIYDKNIWYSKNKIYSWIQGRALETITEYIKNIDLANLDKSKLISYGDILYKKLYSLIDNNDYLLNKLNIPFVFDANDTDIPYSSFDNPTITDMFVLRGVLSYATLRGFEKDYDVLTNKLRYIIKIALDGNLINDQINFETGELKNYYTDRIGIEGVMLSIGASQILFDNTQDFEDLLLGYNSINDILSNFIVEENNKFYISDYLNKDKKPLYNNGDIVNNPGHCIEIIGLALQFLRLNERLLLDNVTFNIFKVRENLANIGLNHYNLGINKNHTINLQVLIKRREVVNNNCPWWSSFEALRMISEIYYLTKDIKYIDLLTLQFDCIENIYLKDLKRNIPLQNVNSEGEKVNSIPATPDIDMGYHTSIPSFDVLDILLNSI